MAARVALLSAFGGCAVGFVAAWLIFRSDGACKVEDAAPSPGLQRVAQEPRATPPAPDLERPDNRAPALTESPRDQEPPIATSSPVAPATPAPSEHESLGDRTTWPSEYANKPLADLIADEARLMEEFKKDLDAEFEKRFKDGRCETRPYDLQSLLGKRTISGSYRGRKVGDTYQSVLLDPSVEPDVFIKRTKAVWLSGEIIMRQR
jgi:hypothetical protein